MEYKVVSSGETSPEKVIEQLEQRVMMQLRDGWVPVGGVSIMLDSRTVAGQPFYIACQAVQKI